MAVTYRLGTGLRPGNAMVGWLHNARAAGQVTLTDNRRRETVAGVAPGVASHDRSPLSRPPHRMRRPKCRCPVVISPASRRPGTLAQFDAGDAAPPVGEWAVGQVPADLGPGRYADSAQYSKVANGAAPWGGDRRSAHQAGTGRC